MHLHPLYKLYKLSTLQTRIEQSEMALYPVTWNEFCLKRQSMKSFTFVLKI